MLQFLSSSLNILSVYMHYEIDQSGKIEDTNKDTILAMSNGKKFAIKINARTKRQLQEFFRKKGKPKVYVYDVFAVGVYFLLKPYLKERSVVIVDKEYWGYEKRIGFVILSCVKKDRMILKLDIVFELIGKNSPAHLLALEITRKKCKAEESLDFFQIIHFLRD